MNSTQQSTIPSAITIMLKYFPLVATAIAVMFGSEAFATPPSNDAQASASILTQKNHWTSTAADYTNVEATNDGSSGSYGAPNNNVWFKFQATTEYINFKVLV